MPAGSANDLSQYEQLSLTSAGDSFIAVQTNTTSGIFTGEADGDFRGILSEVGSLNPLVWLPDGTLVFRSASDGAANLWRMHADGANRRQLTVNAQIDARGICALPDGKYTVFVSRRAGRSNLWRVESDGENLTQLTDGEADAYPTCAADGQTVIYQHGIQSRPTLWKIPLSGGETVPLNEFYGKWPAASRDGKSVSYFHMKDNKWRFGFVTPDGRRASEAVDVPINLKESVVHWSAGGRNLFYIGTSGNRGNLWSLSLASGETKSLTNFASHQLTDFSLAPDGNKFAVSRSVSLSDVVLINEPK